MESIFLNNGIKLIYDYRPGNLTSFCIGFNAGALRDERAKEGTAHALEHMIFKGTNTRSERKINISIDNYFGFSNAMTNYPYAIYYGTCLNENFLLAFELYSDIILNPAFREEGFKEEMDVIKEELEEWNNDLYKFCERRLFYNCFNKRRIKHNIIGTEESLNTISMEDIKRFYKNNYSANNCIISVASSYTLEYIVKVIEENMKISNTLGLPIEKEEYEKNLKGIYTDNLLNGNSAFVQYVFSYGNLGQEEETALDILSRVLGEGINSVLYDELRTKKAIVYDVNSSIMYDTGLKLFTIKLCTSSKNLSQCIEVVNKSLLINNIESYINQRNMNNEFNRMKLKTLIQVEKGVEFCKTACICSLMDREMFNISIPSKKDILEIGEKVFVAPSIQILS